MGTVNKRKQEVSSILQEQSVLKELVELQYKLEIVLNPHIEGASELSEEFKTRVKKDIRKIDNFIDHLQKMRTRY